MAKKKSPEEEELNLPVSTGAVEMPVEPERTQPADNTSTGEVKFDGALGETTSTHDDGSVTVRSQLPPVVTVTASFLSAAEAKVIRAKHAEQLSGSDVDPETKAADSTETE